MSTLQSARVLSPQVELGEARVSVRQNSQVIRSVEQLAAEFHEAGANRRPVPITLHEMNDVPNVRPKGDRIYGGDPILAQHFPDYSFLKCEDDKRRRYGQDCLYRKHIPYVCLGVDPSDERY
jgi:hypothetical protein